MTDPTPEPRPSGGTVRAQLEARHYRTLLGIFLLFVSVAFGVVSLVLTVKFGMPHTLIELTHLWLFPVLLFVGAIALISREALSDMATLIRQALPGGKA